MKLRQRLLRNLLVGPLILLSTAGCSVRAYSGPALPADKVAVVTLHTMGEIAISQTALDGKDVSSFFDNIEMVPGTHELSFNYRVEDQASCYGRNQYCYVNYIDGKCEGTLYTRPGNKYLVTVENRYSSVTTRVTAKGYYDFSVREDEPNPGFITCRDFSY